MKGPARRGRRSARPRRDGKPDYRGKRGGRPRPLRRRGRERPDHGGGRRTARPKGVTVVPDVLANTGGVIVSYFKWVQNLACYSWDEDTVNERLSRKMSDSFRAVWDLAAAENCSLRTAAYMIALRRLVAADRARGTEY